MHTVIENKKHNLLSPPPPFGKRRKYYRQSPGCPVVFLPAIPHGYQRCEPRVRMQPSRYLKSTHIFIYNLDYEQHCQHFATHPFPWVFLVSTHRLISVALCTAFDTLQSAGPTATQLTFKVSFSHAQRETCLYVSFTSKHTWGALPGR